ncbi:unnamed protein product, partial [Allacma fusca]
MVIHIVSPSKFAHLPHVQFQLSANSSSSASTQSPSTSRVLLFQTKPKVGIGIAPFLQFGLFGLFKITVGSLWLLLGSWGVQVAEKIRHSCRWTRQTSFEPIFTSLYPISFYVCISAFKIVIPSQLSIGLKLSEIKLSCKLVYHLMTITKIPAAAMSSMTSKLKKKRIRVKHQKVKVFRANEPLLSVFMWGVNHAINDLSHVNIPVMLMPDDFRSYSKTRVDNHLFNKIAWSLDMLFPFGRHFFLDASYNI